MDDIKISIIIPIYNTGEKLRQCLDSIVNQTVTNFECILVNMVHPIYQVTFAMNMSIKTNVLKLFIKKTKVQVKLEI